MTTLPIRAWLWLVLLAVITLPLLAVTVVAAFYEPAFDLQTVVDPAVRADAVDNAARWEDPAWQEAFERRLRGAGAAAVLVDADGRELYRGPTTAPDPARFAPRDASVPDARVRAERGILPGVEVVLGDGPRPGAIARLHGAPLVGTSLLEGPPGVRRSAFLLLPGVQLAALLLIGLGVAWFVTRALLRPLAAFSRATRQVAAGDLDVQMPASRISEVAEVAAAFGAMSRALRASLERQQELEQERRMVVSAVVHDLRTPLFSLRGYLEGLASGLADSPEKAARYLRVCREKADALERLVADLFAYTRTEYLEEAPRRDPLDLGDLLARVVEGLQPQAAAKGVALALVGSAPVCPVAGDAHLLTRAVDNLLDNAIRHTPAGGSVRVSWRTGADGILFEVADTGPGIAPTDLPHLFAPLYRGEASRNRRTGGAGLGLTIARRLLRTHGGDLSAANRAEGGAVFTGSVPCADVAAAPGGSPAAGPVARGSLAPA